MGVGVLQPWHVIVILVIVLVIFGPGKLPMLGKAVGDTVKDFKKAVSDEPESSADAVPVVPAAPVVAVAPPPAMRECSTCHKPLPATDRFCGACGAQQQVPVA
ncbi:MAG: twin-arginine translocase TatA/TatE family subunit [Chloroflexi bacterium]|nr:twin-arginine translocase TatA/TatE family subunit [Chloroflexota bacterium]MBV9603203.1 twin-arginine translocase TatA/TatE family subunit [Chloroflexota bacterium]